MATTKPKKIRALLGIGQKKDGDLTPILNSTVKGLTASASTYNNLPVPLATYSQAVAAYEAAIPAALNGDKVVAAQKNNLRDAAIQMYVQIAHYVEANCNNDMATFLLSGFQAVIVSRTLAAPASEMIRKVDQGPNSGSLAVTLMKYSGAVVSELRYGAMAAGAAPANWTVQSVVGVQKAAIVSGLIPGTVYAFQVRALLKTGAYTDWSDSVTLMCM